MDLPAQVLLKLLSVALGEGARANPVQELPSTPTQHACPVPPATESRVPPATESRVLRKVITVQSVSPGMKPGTLRSTQLLYKHPFW